MSTDEHGARATADFDHYSEAFRRSRHEQWAKVRQCPVAHNPRYGGFWAVSGYDEVAAVSRDSVTFSSWYGESNDGIDYVGIMGVPRPPGVPPALIAEAEGPTHAALRRLLNPFMLPAAVASYRPFMERCAAWFLDQHIETGQMEVVGDFTSPVPAVLTMKMVGLPCEYWSHYAEVFHALAAEDIVSSDPTIAEHIQTLIAGMIEDLLSVIEERRGHPGDDILSQLLTLDVEGGRRLSDDELIGVLWNLIGGGLDTTTSLTSLALYHLDGHHELRQQLLGDPGLLAPATEEFLRFTSVNETLTRTVTRDVELGSQHLKRGDALMVSWLAANFDEKVFDQPDQVVLGRSPNPHLAFGVGPHRCIGMHVARALFAVMMSEVLRRIPDYQVDREAVSFYRGNPELTGVVSMPATFRPGPRTGVPRPF